MAKKFVGKEQVISTRKHHDPLKLWIKVRLGDNPPCWREILLVEYKQQSRLV